MKSVSIADRSRCAKSELEHGEVSSLTSVVARIAFVVCVGVGVSGCAITQLGGMFGSSSPEATTSSIEPVIPAERSLSMAANEMAQVPQSGAAGDCPRISIWKNESQLTIYELGRVGDNLAIKHRGEITRTARECEITPGQVTVKYGVAGRVLLGPLGKAGTIRLPVLVHVTDRSRKKIQTTRLDVSVNVTQGKLYGRFSTVQSLSFPRDPGIPASQYSVFVTFDHNAPGAG